MTKLYNYFNLLGNYLRKNQEFAWHDYHNVFSDARQVLEQFIAKPLDKTRMLEVGCGQHFTTTLLFHSLGVKVTGIDIEFIDPHSSLKGFFALWRKRGFARFIKTLLRRLIFDRAYYQVIRKEFKHPLKVDNLDLRVMNACALEFPDNHFDYIYSNAVLEHIAEVDKACQEMSRVVHPDGIVYVSIHLFPSLSGGHHPEWAYPDETLNQYRFKAGRRIPPWDHLRQNLFPVDVYLNKLREKDYLSIFNKYFSLIKTDSRYEGEQYLTNDIMKELRGYSRDELLKRTLKVVMKKNLPKI